MIALEPLPTPALPSLAVAFESLLAETEPEVAFKLADLGVAPLKVRASIDHRRPQPCKERYEIEGQTPAATTERGGNVTQVSCHALAWLRFTIIFFVNMHVAYIVLMPGCVFDDKNAELK